MAKREAKNEKTEVDNVENEEGTQVAKQARSLGIAQKGVRTTQDFANMMSAVMSDVIEESISPSVANAAVNAGGKLLKCVELQMKYGRPVQGRPESKNLSLAEESV